MFKFLLRNLLFIKIISLIILLCFSFTNALANDNITSNKKNGKSIIIFGIIGAVAITVATTTGIFSAIVSSPLFATACLLGAAALGVSYMFKKITKKNLAPSPEVSNSVLNSNDFPKYSNDLLNNNTTEENQLIKNNNAINDSNLNLKDVYEKYEKAYKNYVELSRKNDISKSELQKAYEEYTKYYKEYQKLYYQKR